MITPNLLIDKYCARVRYYRGEDGTAQAIAHKKRPKDDNDQDVWERAADRISAEDVSVDDYLDWCFKEALPGLPFLNTLVSNVSSYKSQGSPLTLRKEVALHVKLMLDRLQRLTQSNNENSSALRAEDVLFDPRHEFHPVFATEMATRLGVETPSRIADLADKINNCIPYYLHEMQALLKDWTTIT